MNPTLNSTFALKFAAQRNVLVADTSGIFRRSLIDFMPGFWQRSVNEQDTVEVTAVGTREEAEKALEEKPFDLVITASKLPVLGGGLEFIRSLRQKVQNNPLVIMVTGDMFMTESQVKEAGGDGLYYLNWVEPLAKMAKERFGVSPKAE